jgi:hypothetical protein
MVQAIGTYDDTAYEQVLTTDGGIWDVCMLIQMTVNISYITVFRETFVHILFLFLTSLSSHGDAFGF